MKRFLFLLLVLQACGDGNQPDSGVPRRYSIADTVSAENPTVSLVIPRACSWDVSIDMITHDAERAVVDGLSLRYIEQTPAGPFYAVSDNLETRALTYIEEKKTYRLFLLCYKPAELY